MISIWDVYLDADDAALLLSSVATLERHRAVREPLPVNDTATLLPRLRKMATLYREEAEFWQREADDRELEAEVDGGRWGTPDMALVMRDIASELSAGSMRISSAAAIAAEDLAPRLLDVSLTLSREAATATALEARRLLDRHDEQHRPHDV